MRQPNFYDLLEKIPKYEGGFNKYITEDGGWRKNPEWDTYNEFTKALFRARFECGVDRLDCDGKFTRGPSPKPVGYFEPMQEDNCVQCNNRGRDKGQWCKLCKYGEKASYGRTCPEGGDPTHNCADCDYAYDYMLWKGECRERPETAYENGTPCLEEKAQYGCAGCVYSPQYSFINGRCAKVKARPLVNLK